MNRNTFTDRVKNIVKQIPKGKTLTYKVVAQMAGSPNAFRAVGTIMSKNYDKSIPCHRVIKSDGSVGSYNRGGEITKFNLLKKEKAVIKK